MNKLYSIEIPNTCPHCGLSLLWIQNAESQEHVHKYCQNCNYTSETLSIDWLVEQASKTTALQTRLAEIEVQEAT
jgi:transposase-like protein